MSTPLIPTIYPASHYGLHPDDISIAARTTVQQLVDAGYSAFIVGGGVRDSLLGLHPKDFDVATNATPEQVKQVFGRQCQIIGRRFLLAHVYQGRHLLEVATFRAPHREDTQGETSAHGLIVRDNVWGRMDQDALRRDFTINALYYQPITDEIYDFTGGMGDLEQRQLRMIGDPATRYREDPVRMLRAVRFAVKLGFELDQNTAYPIASLAYLLSNISPHRLFDESLKLFVCGHLQEMLPELLRLGLLKQLFPLLRDTNNLLPMVTLAARNTDERLQAGKSINPAFFYAVLLWHYQQKEVLRLMDHGAALLPASQQASINTLNRQHQRTAIPKFVAQTIREIWELQPRLQQPRARSVHALLNNPRFRAGFDFLWLREQSGDSQTNEMAVWWEEYQTAETDRREQMLRQLDKPTKKGKSKKNKTQTPVIIEQSPQP